MRRRSIGLFLWLGFLLALPQIAKAYQLVCKVVAIPDGDTLTVSDNSNAQHVIRLAGIDAPEHGQPFGAASEKHLADLVLNKNINLDCTNEQSYGRLVCKVLLPSGEDVDLDQVKAGMAWHYKRKLLGPQRRALVSTQRIVGRLSADSKVSKVGPRHVVIANELSDEAASRRLWAAVIRRCVDDCQSALSNDWAPGGTAGWNPSGTGSVQVGGAEYSMESLRRVQPPPQRAGYSS